MCKELIRGQAFDFWEEVGGGGGMEEVIWEKNILKSDFEHKTVLQGNTYHTIVLYVREKHSMITRGLAENNSYANPWSYPNYM